MSRHSQQCKWALPPFARDPGVRSPKNSISKGPTARFFSNLVTKLPELNKLATHLHKTFNKHSTLSPDTNNPGSLETQEADTDAEAYPCDYPGVGQAQGQPINVSEGNRQ